LSETKGLSGLTHLCIVSGILYLECESQASI